MDKEKPASSRDSHDERREWRRSHRQNDIVGPLILIAIGTIFLLNNFNILPWSIWDTLLRFWPVLLINWGIQIILGKSRLANVISLIITLLILAYVVAVSVASVDPVFDSWLHSNFPIIQQINIPTKEDFI